jgi:lon-related putative ATP-dependent protease
MSEAESRNPNSSHGPIAPRELRRPCDPSQFSFESTSELEPLDHLLGQERAIAAIDFGARISRDGYNIFVLGPSRTGRHSASRVMLEAKAKDEPVPDDWVYVNNFAAPDKPRAIRLPSGEGARLSQSMAAVIDDLSAAVPAIFESEDYRNRRKSIDDDFEAAQEQQFEELRKKAEAQNIAILRTPMGFALAPMSNGQVIKPEVFNALPQEVRGKIAGEIEVLQKDLELILRSVPRLEKERRDRIRKLNAELAQIAVDQAIRDTAAQFAGIDEVSAYLTEVRKDLIDNAQIFLRPPQADEEQPFNVSPAIARKHPFLSRYEVNVVVSHDSGPDGHGAPVICESHPTLGNLVGRIDHRSQMGALVTDFTMIKAGALHRANGGYLILDAMKVLTQPFAWEALKRCLRNKTIEITSAGEELSLVTTVLLKPDPIPLKVKAVLVGERILYYLLAGLDPEFEELFKVQADFEDVTERTPEAALLFARLLGTIAQNEGLKPLSRDAVALAIEEASREASDAERLSLRAGVFADLIREADYWASQKGRATISAADIERALDERRRRRERIRERVLENITRDIVLIDTEGEVIGQINGLSVMAAGSLAFGKPTRISARVRMGTGKVVDIEREVELGGPLHSKGVLILSSYLASHYALEAPMSLWASLVFEQSYGGVEGDSASAAELYALLSALAEVPIRQWLAVTGSVNQFGQVQAIGGVNEKIEGFFDICAARGLSGRQGVIIPAANRKHLMLRHDIVTAAEQGKFHIHAVGRIDEGIELLTGRLAGARGADGTYPPDSINGLVETRLNQFAEARRRFARAGAEGGRRAGLEDGTEQV